MCADISGAPHNQYLSCFHTHPPLWLSDARFGFTLRELHPPDPRATDGLMPVERRYGFFCCRLIGGNRKQAI
jgi:hypothetical protein